MELRQLQYAVQIAAEKNFSRAAEKLHIAQPSLSQQLSKLEKEIGVLLFQRNTNSVELTRAGAVFVEKAQSILDQVTQLRNEMEDISQVKKGKLVVGTLPITGSHLLPLVLPVFRQRFPDIEIVLVEETSSRLEGLTASGQTDISLLSLPMEEKSLTYLPLVDEEILLAVPAKHPLAALAGRSEKEGPHVDLADLAGEPFVVLKKGQGFRQMMFLLCQSAGFDPQVAVESGNIVTVQSLVAAGLGIALVPSLVARASEAPFTPVYLPLKGHPTRSIVIAYRNGRYLSKAAEAFISTVHEVFGPPKERTSG
ncbi:putative HTH-type transcriptional regulator YcgK [Paenibacillus sp. J31TS4]|uniref:LysR family transcriptional regulator n=1 Tax=Paenibacillus sp. J31TS4 TaxID=2807195 RepID=UPI001B290E63|nr:LysR family transcriptional regulator [Paenibacillus sp. J31TS4]GIP37412.1 putative HTH-type transcriptional regulator YcgK [Paenibacillus sp. J31TS4]